MLSLLHQIAGRPWAIRAEIAFHIRGLIAKEGIAGLRHLAEIKAAIHEERVEARLGRGPQVSGTIAVIPLIGTMTQRGDVINSAETRSTAAFADQVLAAAAEPKIDAVVLEIDSGGGEVFGVPEAWAAIHAAARQKPIVASANSVAASAALYLASAATEVLVTPSGEAGSVGVFALHVNMAKALQDMGEEWEFVEADDSPFKVENAPDRPLTDDARKQLKRSVNRYMGFFVRDLARGRKVSVEHVRQSFGQGRMLSPQEAVSVKMADAIGSLDVAIARAVELGREKRRTVVGPGMTYADRRVAEAWESMEASTNVTLGAGNGPQTGIMDAPNLREGSEASACLSCEYFSQPSASIPRGPCSRYDFTTDSGWMCDGWEAEEKPEPEEAPAEMPEIPPAAPAETSAASTSSGPTLVEQAEMEAARTRARVL